MTKQIFDDFTNISKNYYNPIDQPLLEEVQFSVKDYKFKVKIGDENIETKKHKNEAIVMVSHPSVDIEFSSFHLVRFCHSFTRCELES